MMFQEQFSVQITFKWSNINRHLSGVTLTESLSHLSRPPTSLPALGTRSVKEY